MEKDSNPFVGPRAFEPGEELFGRKAESETLIDLLLANRIVLMCSPSGAGKTSLIETTTRSQLEAEGINVLPTLRLGRQPSHERDLARGSNRYSRSVILDLDSGLRRQWEKQKEEQRKENLLSPPALRDVGEITLSKYLDALDEANSSDGESPISALILDQFEEVFTTGSLDEDSQRARFEFFHDLGRALRCTNRWALFVMREEYLAPLGAFARSIPGQMQTVFRLGLLERLQAAKAIKRPIERFGVAEAEEPRFRIDDPAVGLLVAELSKVVQVQVGRESSYPGLYVEPVHLQVVCQSLWERLKEERFFDHQNEIGVDQVRTAVTDVDQALGEYYESVLNHAISKSGLSQSALRYWVQTQLISDRGVRTQTLEGPGEGGAETSCALEVFCDEYLVRKVERRGVFWYELAHDRLVAPITSRNEVWQNELLGPIRPRAKQWRREGRPEALLLRGKELENELESTSHVRLGTLEQEFLEESRSAESRREHNLRLAILAALIVGILAYFFFDGLSRKEEERVRAILERAEVATVLSNSREEIARALARVEESRARTARTLDLYLPHVALLRSQQALHESKPAVAAILAKQSYLFRQRFVANAERTGDNEDLGRLVDDWSIYRALSNALGGEYFSEDLEGHTDVVRSLTFTPDGSAILSAGADKRVLSWPVERPYGRPTEIAKHFDVIRSVSISPDQKWIAYGTSGQKKNLLVKALDRDEEASELDGHQSDVRVVLFGPNKSRLTLASGSKDQTVRVWRLDGDFRWSPVELKGHGGEVRTLAFDPQGQYLVSGSSDGTIRFWEVLEEPQAHQYRQPLMHGGTVRSVAIDPSGSWIASAGGLTNSAEVTGFLAPGDEVSRRVPSPAAENGDERRSESYSVKLWSLGDETSRPRLRYVLRHDMEIRSLAFLSRDSFVATTSAGEVIVHTMNSTRPPILLRGHLGWVFQVAVSPVGSSFATAGYDKSVRLWTALDKTGQVELDSAIRSIAVQPGLFKAEEGEKSLVAAGTNSGLLLLFDLKGGDLKLREPSIGYEILNDTRATSERSIRSVSISPGGEMLAVGSLDNTVRLLKTADPLEGAQDLLRTDRSVWAVTFSRPEVWAEKKLLAAGGYDELVWLWDLSEPGRVKGPFGPLHSGHKSRKIGAAVRSLSFSGSGDQLAAATWSNRDRTGPIGRVRVWSGLNSAVERLSTATDSLEFEGRFRKDLSFLDVGWPDPRNPKIQIHSSPWAFSAVEFCGSDDQLVAGNWDGVIRVWDASDLKTAVADPLTLYSDYGEVSAIACHPNGLHVASGHQSGAVLEWNLAQKTARPTILREAHSGWVFTVSYSADGRYLMSGGEDGVIQVQETLDQLSERVCQMVGRNLSLPEWNDLVGDEMPYECTCPDLGPGPEAPTCPTE